ncbi:MAG: VCBS repeat-containing protein [Verrucomicrobia bacterium]|nr:VCBS repeat-containing protein [Verrucomicrobiota bacterium]
MRGPTHYPTGESLPLVPRVFWTPNPKLLRVNNPRCFPSWFLAVILGLIHPAGHVVGAAEVAPVDELLKRGLTTNMTSEATARAVCAACHAFPEPDLLDRATWLQETLPRMAIRLGLSPASVDTHPESELLKATGKFPAVPMITTEVFQSIVQFYSARAPEKPLPQGTRGEIEIGLPGFELVKPQARRRPPMTTLVKILESGQGVCVGDAQAQSLDFYSPTGALVTTLQVSNAPVSFTLRGASAFVSMIGNFFPSEKSQGAFVELGREGARWVPKRNVLDRLPRTVDATFGDLNGDGRADFALCMFGNVQGRLSWFESGPEGRYSEHVLLEKPGAVGCAIHDFNRDGKPDLAALIAQDTESLMIFENKGGREFGFREVFRQHPLYGHTGFELVDFNRDGLMDFLVTNGDNGEYPSPTKRYHGIRLYEAKPDGSFALRLFYPMNGAFRALARDFDQDGDLDIAAVSFFPDYDRSPEESFVYLENRGAGRLRAATFRECISGRWLTMDAGDVDGDGDLDIVLGNNIRGPGKVPDFLKRDWEQFSTSYVLLKNRLK